MKKIQKIIKIKYEQTVIRNHMAALSKVSWVS